MTLPFGDTIKSMSGQRTPRAKREPVSPLRRVDETSAGGLVLDFTRDVPHGALIGRTDRKGRLRWSLDCK